MPLDGAKGCPNTQLVKCNFWVHLWAWLLDNLAFGLVDEADCPPVLGVTVKSVKGLSGTKRQRQVKFALCLAGEEVGRGCLHRPGSQAFRTDCHLYWGALALRPSDHAASSPGTLAIAHCRPSQPPHSGESVLYNEYVCAHSFSAEP